MEQAVVEKYLSEVPYEARAAVMGLNNDLRWAVYVALVLGGRKYFSEIKGEFKANPNTIGPVLKDLVDSGLVAKKIAKFEDFADKRKVFYEPTGLGLRLFEVLSDVAIPKGRGLSESRADVAVAPAVGAETRRDTETRGRCVGQPKITTSGSVAEPGIRWKRVGQPEITPWRNASKACRSREATREIRNRTLRRNRAG
ncbi:MAG: MarR family winged helix-turn-helix transcriptional regulator [Massilibacteroides sp.]|nr:MarR family winged helix-turn-helix transcriptional regulator [Massilibacteroides sp.]